MNNKGGQEGQFSIRARRIFLDPDGTLELGLMLLVRSPTAVIYEHECGGNTNDRRAVEAFAVPVGDAVMAQPWRDWFKRRLRRRMFEITERDFRELEALASQVVAWSETPGEHPAPLVFDRERADETTEAWIPVKSPLGDAVLIFNNSD